MMLEDGHPRVQRGVGVLKDHLHPLAVGQHGALVHRRDVRAVEQDLAAGRLVEAHQRAADRRLAAADSPTRPNVSPAERSKLTSSTALSTLRRPGRKDVPTGKYIFRLRTESNGFAMVTPPLHLRRLRVHQMTRNGVRLVEHRPRRHILAADRHTVLAARREGTALRRHQHIRRRAVDGNQLFIGSPWILGMELSRPHVYGWRAS